MCLCAVEGAAPGSAPAPTVSAPGRLTGSQFVRYIAGMDAPRREQAVLAEILAGDLPAFLRKLVPVRLDYREPGGRTVNATVFVMPEYLAIGSDSDFLRIPMNLHTASAVATRLGYILPTRKIVDAIYRQSAFHFTPAPMTPGPQMRSTEYYREHNQKIEEQSRALGVVDGELVSGDKKDVVLSPRLTNNPEKLAIYGWHRLNGTPIQSLSTVHGACYEDYSHGIRLVSDVALVDGAPRSVYDLLSDPKTAALISDEGPIPGLRAFVEREAGSPCWQNPPQAGLASSPVAALSGDHLMSLTQRKLR